VGEASGGPTAVPSETHVQQVEATTQAAERSGADALAYLKSLVARFANLEVEPIAHESAHPAQDIIMTAGQLGADLIAMATHGRTNVAHALLVSVAEAVVRTGGIPVLLVRPAR
jgi:nucleotide-binding universal stress UspA family protein